MLKWLRWLSFLVLSLALAIAAAGSAYYFFKLKPDYENYASLHKTPAGFFKSAGLELPPSAQILGHQLDSYWHLADTPSHTWIVRLDGQWQEKLLAAGNFGAAELSDTPWGSIQMVRDFFKEESLFPTSDQALLWLKISKV